MSAGVHRLKEEEGESREAIGSVAGQQGLVGAGPGS